MSNAQLPSSAAETFWKVLELKCQQSWCDAPRAPGHNHCAKHFRPQLPLNLDGQAKTFVEGGNSARSASSTTGSGRRMLDSFSARGTPEEPVSGSLAAQDATTVQKENVAQTRPRGGQEGSGKQNIGKLTGGKETESVKRAQSFAEKLDSDARFLPNVNSSAASAPETASPITGPIVTNGTSTTPMTTTAPPITSSQLGANFFSAPAPQEMTAVSTVTAACAKTSSVRTTSTTSSLLSDSSQRRNVPQPPPEIPSQSLQMASSSSFLFPFVSSRPPSRHSDSRSVASSAYEPGDTLVRSKRRRMLLDDDAVSQSGSHGPEHQPSGKRIVSASGSNERVSKRGVNGGTESSPNIQSVPSSKPQPLPPESTKESSSLSGPPQEIANEQPSSETPNWPTPTQPDSSHNVTNTPAFTTSNPSRAGSPHNADKKLSQASASKLSPAETTTLKTKRKRGDTSPAASSRGRRRAKPSETDVVIDLTGPDSMDEDNEPSPTPKEFPSVKDVPKRTVSAPTPTPTPDFASASASASAPGPSSTVPPQPPRPAGASSALQAMVARTARKTSHTGLIPIQRISQAQWHSSPIKSSPSLKVVPHDASSSVKSPPTPGAQPDHPSSQQEAPTTPSAHIQTRNFTSPAKARPSQSPKNRDSPSVDSTSRSPSAVNENMAQSARKVRSRRQSTTSPTNSPSTPGITTRSSRSRSSGLSTPRPQSAVPRTPDPPRSSPSGTATTYISPLQPSGVLDQFAQHPNAQPQQSISSQSESQQLQPPLQPSNPHESSTHHPSRPKFRPRLLNSPFSYLFNSSAPTQPSQLDIVMHAAAIRAGNPPSWLPDLPRMIPDNNYDLLPNYPHPTLPLFLRNIDPRIHWTHPRSEAWLLRKFAEIKEKGNVLYQRKRFFGRVAARKRHIARVADKYAKLDAQAGRPKEPKAKGVQRPMDLSDMPDDGLPEIVKSSQVWMRERKRHGRPYGDLLGGRAPEEM